MTLTPGTQLGPYEIVSQIGEGGMGEVYRARDTKLGRDVAIKVLPAAFSADTDRLRRFEQEAQAAGALNHPNILVPFGEYQGHFSPDGRWFAYTSNESGKYEVYLQSFPTTGGKWQISNAGGAQPHWRCDGKELSILRLTES